MNNKKILTLLTCTLCSLPLLNAEENPLSEGISELASSANNQKISIAFGHLIGKNLETPGITFNTDHVIQGIRDAVAGKESPMTQEEYETTMTHIQEQAFETLATSNLSSAVDFLSQNGQREGVRAIEDGKLQIEVINEGVGEQVNEHGTPTIHYKGTYSDGSLFGSSEDGGGPVTLPLDQTIPGFSKGIVGMKEGEKRRLYIHPDLGYGTAGHLAPNSLLIFEVEVLAVDSNPSSEEVIASETTSDVTSATASSELADSTPDENAPASQTDSSEENIAEVAPPSEESVR